ncbi:MAG: S1-like domain-containing RNA-binding protein [Cetobacterium sp.]|uniref:CvfB family protein n=1 Tax=unclassified Cetobacterium TaxID=2630983 RepID=UPI00163D2B80|nr:S1-like domain-containing RNA-binding protein [Cetobacterium sp. 2A]MBC2855801.1 S1 RNA-binding domain-containing protein [Cetobacterium sp. 2A]MBC2857220.1 S1 RNA-binding domain-containing protein [Cetobacterium sp. 2A]
MVKIGKRQSMKINNFTSIGAYLDGGTDDVNDNILLPNNELEGRDELLVGDEVDVMIYRDSEDRLVATFRKTAATMGTLAKLKVMDVNPKLGAFLDWGLKKELLLPFSQIVGEIKVGQEVLVGIYEDSKNRLSATMKIYSFLMPNGKYEKNDMVEGTVYRVDEELGVFVAVDDRYYGLIPKNECFKNLKVGNTVEARIVRVREDGKLDLAPRALAHIQMSDDAEIILEKMRLLKEHFKFTDSSSPESIQQYFGISKKAFKRAVGSLLKAEKIEKNENGNLIIKQ